MKKQLLKIRFKAIKVISVSILMLIVSPGFAQSSENNFSKTYPELAKLFSAFDFSQAMIFEEMVGISSSPATQKARDEFEQKLEMEKKMSMAEMMSMMSMHMNMDMSNSGPFSEFEIEARMELIDILEGSYSATEVEQGMKDSGLSERAIAVVQRGNDFEKEIYEIYANEQVLDKSQALDNAVEAYLSVISLSVPTRAKSASNLHAHPYANAFSDAYPILSSMLWSTQWLELAVIEAMILESQDDYYKGSVEIVKQRFWGKLKNKGDMSLEGTMIFPTPVELPMAPAIAPQLYTASPEAAVIIDNLNMMKTIIADILAYPNIQGRELLITAVVDDFTNHSENLDANVDYLISALRGGIFNQGGPAIGKLQQSERNKSRMQMGMQHSMIMSN